MFLQLYVGISLPVRLSLLCHIFTTLCRYFFAFVFNYDRMGLTTFHLIVSMITVIQHDFDVCHVFFSVILFALFSS
jgi:hypothetical protein